VGLCARRIWKVSASLARLRGMGGMVRGTGLVMQFWVQYRSDLAAMGSSESEESEFQSSFLSSTFLLRFGLSPLSAISLETIFFNISRFSVMANFLTKGFRQMTATL